MNLLYEYRQVRILMDGLPKESKQFKEAKTRLKEIYVDLIDNHYRDIPKRIRRYLNLRPRKPHKKLVTK